jgi:hypothetical protein
MWSSFVRNQTMELFLKIYVMDTDEMLFLGEVN